jgi:hypothetical protein
MAHLDPRRSYPSWREEFRIPAAYSLHPSKPHSLAQGLRPRTADRGLQPPRRAASVEASVAGAFCSCPWGRGPSPDGQPPTMPCGGRSRSFLAGGHAPYRIPSALSDWDCRCPAPWLRRYWARAPPGSTRPPVPKKKTWARGFEAPSPGGCRYPVCVEQTTIGQRDSSLLPTRPQACPKLARRARPGTYPQA